MKKYSQYFKNMMITSIVFLILFILCMPQFVDTPEMGAITITLSFVFWFAGIMAPDNEKYKKHGRRR